MMPSCRASAWAEAGCWVKHGQLADEVAWTDNPQDMLLARLTDAGQLDLATVDYVHIMVFITSPKNDFSASKGSLISDLSNFLLLLAAQNH